MGGLEVSRNGGTPGSTLGLTGRQGGLLRGGEFACASLPRRNRRLLSRRTPGGDQIHDVAISLVRLLREARDGRNPKTGEPVHISAKRTPFFKVGKELKEMVDSSPVAGDGSAGPGADAAGAGNTSAS